MQYSWGLEEWGTTFLVFVYTNLLDKNYVFFPSFYLLVSPFAYMVEQ